MAERNTIATQRSNVKYFLQWTLAVLRVWLELVSPPISLILGKIQGISAESLFLTTFLPDQTPPYQRLTAAIVAISREINREFRRRELGILPSEEGNFGLEEGRDPQRRRIREDQGG